MIRSNDIQIVIGSWGSYNECNERALGSKWICLNNYEDWEEIEEELKAQGFELDGIDEELFIQDIENFPCDSGVNWDYVHLLKVIYVNACIIYTIFKIKTFLILKKVIFHKAYFALISDGYCNSLFIFVKVIDIERNEAFTIVVLKFF